MPLLNFDFQFRSVIVGGWAKDDFARQLLALFVTPIQSKRVHFPGYTHHEPMIDLFASTDAGQRWELFRCVLERAKKLLGGGTIMINHRSVMVLETRKA